MPPRSILHLSAHEPVEDILSTIRGAQCQYRGITTTIVFTGKSLGWQGVPKRSPTNGVQRIRAEVDNWPYPNEFAAYSRTVAFSMISMTLSANCCRSMCTGDKVRPEQNVRPKSSQHGLEPATGHAPSASQAKFQGSSQMPLTGVLPYQWLSLIHISEPTRPY